MRLEVLHDWQTKQCRAGCLRLSIYDEKTFQKMIRIFSRATYLHLMNTQSRKTFFKDLISVLGRSSPNQFKYVEDDGREKYVLQVYRSSGLRKVDCSNDFRQTWSEHDLTQDLEPSQEEVHTILEDSFVERKSS